MIADAHAHTWSTWPYARAGLAGGSPPACDVDALLATLDENGVDRALVVAARLEAHAGNNEYVLEAAARHPDRLWAAVEVGSFFAPPDSAPADRLRHLVDGGPVAAVALFPDPAAPGWLTGDGGRSVLAVAATHRLLVSVAAPPALHDDLRSTAAAWPGIHFVAHHAGMAQAHELAGVLALAAEPNVSVKLSGLHYLDAAPHEIVGPLLAGFGPSRLLWGSDFPAAARRGIEYADTLAAVRAIIPTEHHAAVLGGNLGAVLAR